jgi:hypothetical protein
MRSAARGARSARSPGVGTLRIVAVLVASKPASRRRSINAAGSSLSTVNTQWS